MNPQTGKSLNAHSTQRTRICGVNICKASSGPRNVAVRLLYSDCQKVESLRDVVIHSTWSGRSSMQSKEKISEIWGSTTPLDRLACTYTHAHVSNIKQSRIRNFHTLIAVFHINSMCDCSCAVASMCSFYSSWAKRLARVLIFPFSRWAWAPRKATIYCSPDFATLNAQTGGT